jgi:hypothetical protein
MLSHEHEMPHNEWNGTSLGAKKWNKNNILMDLLKGIKPTSFQLQLHFWK